MITLRAKLNKEDFKFMHLYLGYLENKRQGTSTKEAKSSIFSLAFCGQLESIQFYLEHLNSNDTLNTQIFKKINEIERAGTYGPRENMLLHTYYKWQIDKWLDERNKPGDASVSPQQHPKYGKCIACKLESMDQLEKIAKIDGTARQYLIETKTDFSQDFSQKFLTEMANERSSLSIQAYRHVVDNTLKLKLLYAYAKNLILFSNNLDYSTHEEELTTIKNDIQKTFLSYTPPKTLR